MDRVWPNQEIKNPDCCPKSFSWMCSLTPMYARCLSMWRLLYCLARCYIIGYRAGAGSMQFISWSSPWPPSDMEIWHPPRRWQSWSIIIRNASDHDLSNHGAGSNFKMIVMINSKNPWWYRNRVISAQSGRVDDPSRLRLIWDHKICNFQSIGFHRRRGLYPPWVRIPYNPRWSPAQQKR